MTVVPAATGIKTPVPASIVAVAGVPLDHVPPVGVAAILRLVPIQVDVAAEVMLTVGGVSCVIATVMVAELSSLQALIAFAYTL